MKELSLYTGAGGGLLGTKLLGWESVGYIEIDDYCQRIIKQRIKDGILDEAPIFSDIKTFNNEGFAEAYKGLVDVITAGFPCQPFSVAGKQKGEDDERNMWPETIRTINAVRPGYVFLENVPGLLGSYLGQVLSDLAESGYDCRWRCLSAAEVGAPQKEIASGLWPTPTSSMVTTTDLVQAKYHSNKRPTYQDAKKMIPTPSSMPRGAHKNRKIVGNSTVSDTTGTRWGMTLETYAGGSLNPTWVEWLMGWPLGWTDLKPLEMDRFRQWLRQFGGC